MANTKNTMTQAMAIRFLIDHAPEETPEEVIEAAEKVYTAKTKKYTRKSDTPTKAHALNTVLAREMVDLINAAPEGTTINAKYLAGVWEDPEVRSSQKVVAIAKVAEEMGLIRKFVNEKKVTCYEIAE